MSSLLADARLLLGAAWRLDRRRVLVQIVLLLVTGVTGGANLLLLIPIINSLANPGGEIVLPFLGSVGPLGVPLPALLGLFVLLVSAQALLTRAATVNGVIVRQQLVDGLRREAFEAVLGARWSFILGRRSSDIIEVATTGAARCGIAYEQLLRLAITGIMAAATAAVALLVSPMVAGLAILGVALVGLGMATVLRPANRLGKDFGERNRDLYATMTDSLSSLRLVRAHDAGAVWAERVSAGFRETRAIEVSYARRSSLVSAASQSGLAAAAALLVLVAVWQEVPTGSIVLLLLLTARLARSVQTMASIGAVLAYALPGARDIASLTVAARAAAEVPVGGASGGRAPLAPGPDRPLLEFRDVSFTYPDSDNGVQGLSFSVPYGRVTALTGHSGAGKSTTADLVLGLLMPQSGAVLVDGRPLEAGDLAWWRQQVAYVPQETVLFPGTLRENLAWSVPGGASDAQCWAALDQAAARFARALPAGLDTRLGERGVRLSGGERQRVAIARALLRRPALLVLDEATSALDDATEAEVLEVVGGLVPAVTVLVIAHRRSTIDLAEHRLELERGRLVG